MTGDAAAASTTDEEVDSRITKLLDIEDPDLIWDLRVQSTGCPNSYTAFLHVHVEECNHYLESSVETAVNERHHYPVDCGEVVTHLARALSVRDMYDQVCKKCPEGTREHHSHPASGSGG